MTTRDFSASATNEARAALYSLVSSLLPALAPLASLVSVVPAPDARGLDSARFEGNARPGAPFAYSVTLSAVPGGLAARFDVLNPEPYGRPDVSEYRALAEVFGLDYEATPEGGEDEAEGTGPASVRAFRGLVLSRVAALYAVGGSFRGAAFPFGGDAARLYGYPVPGSEEGSAFPPPGP